MRTTGRPVSEGDLTRVAEIRADPTNKAITQTPPSGNTFRGAVKLLELVNQNVVVTGGGSGIGAAMCRRFYAEKPRMITVVDIDRVAAEGVATEVGGVGVECDVGVEEQMVGVIDEVEKREGPIDLLVMNAGIAAGGDVFQPSSGWERAWQVNVMAHVYAVRAALTGMLANGGGYLLHTSSAAGLLTNIGAAPYSVTKHAVIALAEWLAVTYGDAGIKVSCLCPQFVTTPMLEDFATLGKGKLRSWIEGVVISPEKVADAVVEGIAEERFLILPHPEVAEYLKGKTNNYDRWLQGMRKLQASLLSANECDST